MDINKVQTSAAIERLRKQAAFPDEMHGIVGNVLIPDVRLVLNYVDHLERYAVAQPPSPGELDAAKKQIRALAKELENANELLDQYRSDYIRARF